MYRGHVNAGLHPMKVLVSICWDNSVIIHFDIFAVAETIIAKMYCHQLTNLNVANQEKTFDFGKSKMSHLLSRKCKTSGYKTELKLA